MEFLVNSGAKKQGKQQIAACPSPVPYALFYVALVCRSYAGNTP